jgi:gag-polypeptide of LTR copia-type
VFNAKTKNLPSGDASLAWEKLKTRFEPTSGAALTQLTQEFHSSRLQKGESPDDWIERLESVRSRIEQILAAERISNQNLMLHIMGHLLEEYDNIVDRAGKELNNRTLTIDTLQEDLQLKYERMKTKKGYKGEQALFAKQFKGKCALCGKIGHKKENCWESKSNKSKKLKGYKQRGKKESGHKNPNIICYNCNEKFLRIFVY